MIVFQFFAVISYGPAIVLERVCHVTRKKWFYSVEKAKNCISATKKIAYPPKKMKTALNNYELNTELKIKRKHCRWYTSLDRCSNWIFPCQASCLQCIWDTKIKILVISFAGRLLTWTGYSNIVANSWKTSQRDFLPWKRLSLFLDIALFEIQI